MVGQVLSFQAVAISSLYHINRKPWQVEAENRNSSCKRQSPDPTVKCFPVAISTYQTVNEGKEAADPIATAYSHHIGMVCFLRLRHFNRKVHLRADPQIRTAP